MHGNIEPEAGGPLWAGVDIGGTKTAEPLPAKPPALLARVEFAAVPADGPEPAVARIRENLRTLLREQGGGLAAIGVSCGGPPDRVKGVIQSPPNPATWIDVPITDILSREFGVRGALENDANAGAVAEHRFGAGQGVRNINKAGSTEGWASGGGIAHLAALTIQAARRRGRPTILCEGATARDVAEAARNGDRMARDIILTAGRRRGDAILEPARRAIRKEALKESAAACRIVRAALGERIGDIADLSIAMAFCESGH